MSLQSFHSILRRAAIRRFESRYLRVTFILPAHEYISQVVVDGRGSHPLRRSDLLEYLLVAGDGDAVAVRESPVGVQARFFAHACLNGVRLGRGRVERGAFESLPHRAPELGAQVLRTGSAAGKSTRFES